MTNKEIEGNDYILFMKQSRGKDVDPQFTLRKYEKGHANILSRHQRESRSYTFCRDLAIDDDVLIREDDHVIAYTGPPVTEGLLNLLLPLNDPAKELETFQRALRKG